MQRHERIRRYPHYTKQEREHEEAQAASAEVQRADVDREKLAVTDELLEEIDEVLDVNPAQFVREFVQKNGE